MLKHVVVGLTVALLVSSSAFGTLIQGQTMAIGTSNTMQLIGADASGSWNQNLVVDLTQEGEGSGLMLARTYMTGSSYHIGGLTSLTGLLGGSHIGLGSALGTSSLLLPSMTVTSADALLARARLNSLLLGL